MRPEFVVNLICPAIIILFGTIGNGLALWTLIFSKILRNRIARYLDNFLSAFLSLPKHYGLSIHSSIFLITLYCADSSAILSGYCVQWIINLMTINVTDIVNYESIRYEIDSNTSMYLFCFTSKN